MKTAIAVLLMTASAAHAASLKELLDAADKENVDRRISIEQRRRASAEAVQAWTTLLPIFSASATWTHNQYAAVLAQPITYADVPANVVRPRLGADGQQVVFEATITPYQQYDAVFRLDVPLIDVSRWFRIGASNEAENAASDREDLTRDSVKRQVVGTYYAYAAALAVRESAKRSVKVAEAQAELQEVRAKAGAATELERLRALAEVQRNRQLVADTEVNVAVNRRSLRTLTGTDPGEIAALPEDDVRPEPPYEELEKNVESLPAVRAADHDAAAVGKNGNAARMAILPTISGQITERISSATGFTGQAAAYNGGLAATWRLDGPTIAGFKVQSAAEETARLAAERARLQARDQIFNDWQRHNASLQKINSAKAQLEAAGRAAQVARDRYAAGAATQLDVITAERDLLSAEVGDIQARTELASARLVLRISSGQPLQVE